MKKKKAIILCTGMAVLTMSVYWVVDCIIFLNLRHMSRVEGNYDGFVKFLGKTRYGVNLALDDFTIWGGHTRSASTAILVNSTLKSTNNRLIKVLNSDSADLAKRTAAADILWRRTQDEKYLVEWFDLIKEPNKNHSLAISFARASFSNKFTNHAFRVMMGNADETSSIDLSTEEFTQQLQSGTLGHRDLESFYSGATMIDVLHFKTP